MCPRPVVGERLNIADVCMTEVYMCSVRVSSNIITSSYTIGTLVQGCKQVLFEKLLKRNLPPCILRTLITLVRKLLSSGILVPQASFLMLMS